MHRLVRLACLAAAACLPSLVLLCSFSRVARADVPSVPTAGPAGEANAKAATRQSAPPTTQAWHRAATRPAGAAGGEGFLPVGDDGKPLNTDFETGDLRDWTATGNAFTGQPVRGDIVRARRADQRSRHAGNYW